MKKYTTIPAFLILCLFAFFYPYSRTMAQSTITPMKADFKFALMIDMGAHITSSTNLQLPYFKDEGISNSNAGGSGYTFGVYTRLFLGDKDSTKHSISLNLNYTSITTNEEFNIQNTKKYIYPTSDNVFGTFIVKGSIGHELNTLDFRALYNYNITGNLFVSIGPRLLFVLKNHVVETASIEGNMKNKVWFVDDLKPKQFKDDSLTAVLTDGQSYGSRGGLFGLNIELKNQIELSDKADIIPYIGYNNILTSLTSNSGLTMTSIYFGLCFVFKLL